MPRGRLLALIVLTLAAFAGNSLLCRAALATARTDAATFTTLRIVSGALMLSLLVRLRARSGGAGAGSWGSALALFVYAAAFSFAYTRLRAGTGALLLFGAVQATMIGWGLRRGERLGARQSAGFGLACAGLIALLLPGIGTPPLRGTALMLLAGVAWGIYSLRGRNAGDPLHATAGNFRRAVPLAVGASVLAAPAAALDSAGAACAIASGALTSGVGYALWYSVLPWLPATHAAILQLSVPVIAALGGVALLGETVTLRLFAAALAILGGIALVFIGRKAPRRGA